MLYEGAHLASYPGRIERYIRHAGPLPKYSMVARNYSLIAFAVYFARRER